MPFGAPGDCREHDLWSRHGEVGAVVLADAEGVDAEFVGEDRLLDHVADDLRMRQKAAVGVGGDVAERIQPEFEILLACLSLSRALAPG